MTIRPRRPRAIRALLAASLSLALLSAHAHSVWLEPADDGALRIRFAEPDGKFETSPGHLDELSAVTVHAEATPGTPTPLEATKKRDHFQIAGSSAAQVTAAEATYMVMGAPGRPGRKPVFHARWHPNGAPPPAPGLNLDLVPTGKPGEIRAFFRGKPLGGVTATLRLPDERERELTADADGFLRFTPEQKGVHQIRIARHRETLPGFHQGRAHDLTSHNACLAWIEP